eukprot:Em0034g27a
MSQGPAMSGWITGHAGQVVLTVSQIMWNRDLTKCLVGEGTVLQRVKEAEQRCFQNLNKLAELVCGELPKLGHCHTDDGRKESPRSVEDQFVEDQFVKDQSVKDEWDAVTTNISALLTSVGESPVDKRRIGNKRIEMEFGTTNHMARLAKALVASKGILATPNPRSGKTLSDDTVQLVKLFYVSPLWWMVKRKLFKKGYFFATWQSIVDIYYDMGTDEISYKAWVSVDRTTLETLTKSTEDFVNTLLEASANLRKHDFIAKQQASFLADLKANLKEGEVIVMGDFSENYSFIIQDAVQGYHWNNDQATIHPFVVYYTNQGVLQSLNFVVISNCLVHDSVAVHLFVRKLLEFLTAKIVVEKVYYFSDGAASQYKNRKNFVNLAFHMEDFKLPAEWHFFATAHGKGPYDGLGGTVKRGAATASLQRPLEDQIQSPMQLYEWAKGAIPSVQFHYVDVAEIDAEERILQKRLDASITIAGTQSFHAYYALPNKTSMFRVKIYSNSSKSEIAKVSNHRELLSKEDMAGYVICEYNSQWWLAMIMENYDDIHEVQVLFLHPAGPSPSFSFPRRQDKLNINYTQVLMKVNPTTSTGRVYSIKPQEALQATLLLHA